MPRIRETFAVYSGDFASQQLAFAHLLDSCDRLGVHVDFDFVDVIPVATAKRRLGAYFEGTTADQAIAAADGDTLIVIRSAACNSFPPFSGTERLSLISTLEGTAVSAGIET